MFQDSGAAVRPSTPDTVSLAEVYRFLAQAMRLPAPDWCDESYQELFFSFAELLFEKEAIDSLRQTFAQDPEWLSSLQVEYTRLFVNAKPKVIAPPYASIYLSDEGSFYGPAAVAIKDYYRACGFAPAGEGDFPDHLCLELEFLGLLAEQGRQPEMGQFLKGHFRPWFPSFRDQVCRATSHPYYRLLVQLIDILTQEEDEDGITMDEA